MPRLLHFQPGGIAEYWGPEGVVTKHASTCAHCQHISEFDRIDMDKFVDRCRGCMRLICLTCARKPCLPWEKQCAAEEADAIKRKVEVQGWRCY